MAQTIFTWNQWKYFNTDLGLIAVIKNHGKTSASFADNNVSVAANASGVQFTIGEKVINFTWAIKAKVEKLASMINQLKDSGYESATFTDSDINASASYDSNGVTIIL